MEYAGDFIDQKSDGSNNTFLADGTTPNPSWNIHLATVAKPFIPDGTDFYVDGSGVHHIRWYGLPRDANGDGQISIAGVGVGVPVLAAGQSPDVLPLAYYLGTPTAFFQAPFEENVQNWNSAWSTNPSASTFNQYVCQWDATSSAIRPTMFRITIELIDADGRLSSPRVLQYIVPVAQS